MNWIYSGYTELSDHDDISLKLHLRAKQEESSLLWFIVIAIVTFIIVILVIIIITGMS